MTESGTHTAVLYVGMVTMRPARKAGDDWEVFYHGEWQRAQPSVGTGRLRVANATITHIFLGESLI